MRRAPQAAIRPGKPAPTSGPGTELAVTVQPSAENVTNSGEARPPAKGLTCLSLPLMKVTMVAMLAPPGPPGAPIRVMLNVSLQQIGPSSTGSFILKLNACTTPAASGFAAIYVPLRANTPSIPPDSWTLAIVLNRVKPDWVKDGSPTSVKSAMSIVAAEALIGPTKASAAIPVSNDSLLFMVSSPPSLVEDTVSLWKIR